MAFGVTPRCERCGDAVYHAEQVMGPARKIYHKPCLKCDECGKRLDPGGLVEHDTRPYCSRCHTQAFGTRDLRHGNVSAPSTPRKQPPLTPSKSLPPIAPKPTTPRTVPPPQEYYTPPRLDPAASTPEPADRDSGTPVTRPNFRDSRPISVPYGGKFESLDERGLIRRGDSPRSKIGEKVTIGEEMCWGCEKRVYAAEQLFAVGHKGCLRCNSCRTTLNPSKVSDRYGVPMCKNCYAKEHGPEGIMGKR